MIIKSKKEKTEVDNNNIKRVLDKINFKKIICFVLILLALIFSSVFIYKIVTKKYNVYIEVASKDKSYTYGPNGSSTLNMVLGEDLDILIISDNNKKVKCYSSDESIISFSSFNTLKAVNNGTASIYCKLKNTKSNEIEIIVGGN